MKNGDHDDHGAAGHSGEEREAARVFASAGPGVSRAPRDMSAGVMARIAARTCEGTGQQGAEHGADVPPELQAVAGALRDAAPDMDDDGRVAAGVMRRARRSAVAGQNQRPSLLLRVISHTGVAIAAGLMVALLYAPVREWVGGGANDVPAPENTVAENVTAGNGSAALTSSSAAPEYFTAKLWGSRELDGRLRYIVSAGAIDGVRNGDSFALSREPGGEAIATLVVIGISPYAAVCEPAGESKFEARAGDWLRTEPTAAMRAAKLRLASGPLNDGGFYGLGAVLADSAMADPAQTAVGGVVVEEILSEYWLPDRPRATSTRAARLKLCKGDRVVSLMGEPISRIADLAAVLDKYPPEKVKLSATVERGSTKIELSEP
jgi:hypothetical protein